MWAVDLSKLNQGATQEEIEDARAAGFPLDLCKCLEEGQTWGEVVNTVDYDLWYYDTFLGRRHIGGPLGDGDFYPTREKIMRNNPAV